jgi:hypothetical protein
MPVELIDAADVEPSASHEPATETTPTHDALSDDSLNAIYDKIQAGPEAPEGDPDDPVDDDSADQPTEPEDEPAVTQAIAAPAAWSAEKKALWPTLSPDAQQYIADRESKAHGQISQMGQQLSQLKPVGELRSQYQDVFDRNGMDFVEGFHTLMAAQNLLEQDPMKGIAAIAQTFGIDLAQAFGGQAQQPQGQQPQSAPAPEIQRLQHQIQKLEGILTEQQRATIATQTAEARRMVEASSQEIGNWAKDKPFHDDLAPTMAEFFKTGVANTLDEAREMALIRHPEIREKVEASRKEAEAASALAAKEKARKEQEKVVAAAKRAAKTNGGNRIASVSPAGRWDDDKNLGAIFDSVAAS